MRSRSRERSSYVSDQRGRERDNYRRDRSRERDSKYGDTAKRSRDSRSRSRDRVKPRERVNDASRELREVKRILSNPTGDSKGDRDRRDNERGRSDSLKDNRDKDNRERSRNDGSIQPNTTGRKTNYDDYNRHGSRNDDDETRKEQKRLRREGSFHDNTDYKDKPKDSTPSRSDSTKEGKENKGSAEKAYDEKELAEIEQFLAKTATVKPASNGSTKENGSKTEPTTPGKSATTVTTSSKTEVETKSDKNTEEEEDEVDLVWEDEETVARKEEQAAEERRRKRLEIASKYNKDTNNVTSTSGSSKDGGAAAAVLTSPTKLAISAFDGTKGLPSPKAVVPVVDFSSDNNKNNNVTADKATNKVDIDITSASTSAAESSSSVVDTGSLMENILPGNASLTVPTTSLHLAKLALHPSDADAEPSRDETERQQLENEKAALLQEERRERGMSDLSIGGYGGYGAGGRVEFDMFSASPSGIEQTLGVGKKGQAVVNAGRRAMRDQLVDQNNTDHTDPHLQSNWDDGEGYYKARIGECVGDRFRILGVVGKGVFSTVLKCVDLYSPATTNNNTNNGASTATTTATESAAHVAIKMIRNNDTMRKAAEKEKSILLSIAQADPHNTKYCVRLLTHLDYRNHVAMVFEYQSMNLRETLKKFGKDVGINIGAIRMYGKQLFVALDLLMKLRIVHADIKLDNILCSGDLKQIKLCDFGSAFRETDTDNDPTPYLVSRFYRAPEIILGMQYDRAIDLWSVCVCLYELFTGHVMFPGRTNNEMLKLMMAVKGKIQNKQIKTHMRAYEVLQLEPHFDPDMRFRQYEADPITGKTVLRLIDVQNPTRDLASVLRSSKAGADDMLMVTRLTDFLEKGLNLDPTKRLTVTEALKHPFFSSSTAAAVGGK
eukprot:gene7858-9370_t